MRLDLLFLGLLLIVVVAVGGGGRHDVVVAVVADVGLHRLLRVEGLVAEGALVHLERASEYKWTISVTTVLLFIVLTVSKWL